MVALSFLICHCTKCLLVLCLFGDMNCNLNQANNERATVGFISINRSVSIAVQSHQNCSIVGFNLRVSAVTLRHS